MNKNTILGDFQKKWKVRSTFHRWKAERSQRKFNRPPKISWIFTVRSGRCAATGDARSEIGMGSCPTCTCLWIRVKFDIQVLLHKFRILLKPKNISVRIFLRYIPFIQVKFNIYFIAVQCTCSNYIMYIFQCSWLYKFNVYISL